MKKFIKWTLISTGGLILVLVVFGAVLAALNWSTVQILSGTEGITGAQAGIPAPVEDVNPAIAGEYDWLAWRGTNNDGKSGVTGINKDWSGGLKKLWEVDYLCQNAASASWSAPAIRGNRLIVPGRDETDDLLFALDPDSGALLWVGGYEAPAGTSHGPGPRATPYIDEERVYTFGRSGDLVCWNLEDGSILWHKNVTDEGGEEPQWGHSSSPFVWEDKVVVQAGGQARTIAYNKISGDVIWKSGQGLAGYAGFAIVEDSDQAQLVVFHGKGVAGLDVENGAILWDLPWESPYDINASTPIVIDNKAFITSRNDQGGQLMQMSRDAATILWTGTALASLHSDPFIINDAIYGYSGESSQNKGAFICIDLKTGDERWTTNEIGWGTCSSVDGFLITMDIRGNLSLVQPDPDTFVQVTRFDNALGQIRGPVWTVPVIANGKLYLRFKQHLVCYDLMN